MAILIPTFLFYLLLMGSACAKVNAPNCTNDTFTWSSNSLGQNPCWVAAYLEGQCSSGAFDIPPLNLEGYMYGGPNGDQGDDICQCNTVVYSLVGACGACQGGSWPDYPTWSYNCTNNAIAGIFPESVPDGTRVPKWAYLPLVLNDSWDITLAQSVGEFPEVTGSTSISSIIPTSTSHHTANTDAIAGGVVGGIVGTALIAGVVFWSVLRRRRARSVPSSDMGEKEQPPPIFYDPSDPTTYPGREYLLQNPLRLGSTSCTQLGGCEYTGRPEV